MVGTPAPTIVNSGPGKFEEVSELETTTLSEATIVYRLFNFNKDDATLKPEHKAFLETGFMALISVFKEIRVEIRGEASLTGNSAYNLALGQKRATATRDFLLKTGASSGKLQVANIQANSAGDHDAHLAGEKAGTEDPKFRAVLLTVRIPSLNVLPRFTDFPGTNQGFDDHNLFQPPWVLVAPEGVGFRLVFLNHATGLTLKTTKPGIIKVLDSKRRKPVTRVTESKQLLVLQTTGHLGETEVRAVDHKGKPLARLHVAVLPKLTVTVAFHYIRNPDRTSGVATHRQRISDNSRIISGMNGIYEPQANIVFRQIGGLSEPIVTKDLGQKVDTDNDAQWNAVANSATRNASARFNVFFVTEIEDEDFAATDIGTVDCICGDDTADGGSDAAVLAHEAGHALAVDHNTPIHSTSDMLMFAEESGNFIPQEHVMLMREKVSVVKPSGA